MRQKDELKKTGSKIDCSRNKANKMAGNLHDSYEFNRTLLQSSPSPILVTNLDTSVYR